MFSGKANSTSFSLLTGKMPAIPFRTSLKSALVIVAYSNNQQVIDTSIGVFTSVKKIITYKKCLGEISVRRENSPSSIFVHSAKFEGDVTTIYVSCSSSKSFYILKLWNFDSYDTFHRWSIISELLVSKLMSLSLPFCESKINFYRTDFESNFFMPFHSSRFVFKICLV